MIGRLFLFALATLAGWSVLADENGLVRVGEYWRYWKGTHEPAPLWKHPGFEDAGWASGRSGFSITRNFYDEATFIAPGIEPFVSLYLRKKFEVNDPERIAWLLLRIDYDDGFAAYLNGREMVRRNLPGMPGAPAPFNALAQHHPRGVPEEIDLTEYREWLLPGENVLALQVHKSSKADPTLSVTAELVANFTRGPFVQNSSSNSAVIIWKTFFPCDSRIEYGRDPSMEWTQFSGLLTTNHVMTLTNLIADTEYFYRISSARDGVQAAGSVERFQTLKTIGPIEFMVLGDTGAGSAAQYEIAEMMERHDPDLVLHAGDVVYPAFTYELADLRCLSVYRPHMKRRPYYFAIGNHDLYAGDEPYLDTFHLPVNSETGTEHYYSFSHGEAYFAVLYFPYLSQHTPQLGDAQYRWLDADLAASDKPWKILVLHHPLNTSGLHRWDDKNLNGILDRTEVMDFVLPLAEKHGVQLVFSGHDHDFERFTPTNGVHLVVTGGGGVGLYPLMERDPASAQFWMRHHAVKVQLDRRKLLLEALDASGNVFDFFTIHRELVPGKIYQASWNSPLVESGPANDGQGNITGQEFDFVGEPIPALSGAFSNLGRVYVNNDATTLFVGIEQAMIYPGHDIYFFVESAGLAGVSGLAGLGNGLNDPEEQGADGLDFLENLWFSDFRPGIGCILGDEFADGQDRAFGRLGMNQKLGQGIFYLDADFSDVPGIRLQQYNLSPQRLPQADEQNADYIELAIPLEALGKVRPGDVIKIGAVVGGNQLDLSGKRRNLDGGFVGAKLDGSGLGPVKLEGVAVQLAENPALPLRVTITSESPETYRLSWRGVIGRKYQVQFTPDMQTAFRNVSGDQEPMIATEPDLHFEGVMEAGEFTSGMRIYRVIALE
jgi:acid phosphatase type 7